MLLPLVLAGAALVALSKKKDGFKIGAKMRRRKKYTRHISEYGPRQPKALVRPPTGYAAAVKSRIV